MLFSKAPVTSLLALMSVIIATWFIYSNFWSQENPLDFQVIIAVGLIFGITFAAICQKFEILSFLLALLSAGSFYFYFNSDQYALALLLSSLVGINLVYSILGFHYRYARKGDQTALE